MSAETFAAKGAAHVAISTAAELRQRVGERPKPAAEPHHTIGGPVETDVRKRLDQLREARIGHLDTRLSQMKEKAQTDHVFSALKGKSRTDFERSR